MRHQPICDLIIRENPRTLPFDFERLGGNNDTGAGFITQLCESLSKKGMNKLEYNGG
jgi:hypothetical protein